MGDGVSSTSLLRVRPAFVVFEGIDGSGTTTQLALVSSWFEERGARVHVTREPSTGPVGVFLRQALQKRLTSSTGEPRQLDGSTMALLFAADRLDHVEQEIRPQLAQGALVISDRYDLSSLIYQSATSAKGAESLDWLRSLNQQALRPDLVLVFSLDAETARERRLARGGAQELFEEDRLQAELAGLYQKAQEFLPGDRVEFVDATRSIGEVTTQVVEKISRLLEALSDPEVGSFSEQPT